MRRFMCVLLVWLLGAVVTAPGCNIFQDIGNAECSAANQGEGGDDGVGGDDGAGGDQGAGGGVYSSDVGVGAGPPTSADVGVGAGPASSGAAGAGAGDPGARHAPGRPQHDRRHHGHEHLGTAVSADCPATLAALPLPPPPNWIGLDTGTLRNICINNDVNGSASQSGITLNRTCGVAFETWCLKTMGWLPRWTMLIPSQARKNANVNKGGLPASVIPEKVLDQSSFTLGDVTWAKFPQSVFVEVKAVNGTLTLGTSQYQVLGLVDGVNNWPTVPAGTHAPPAVLFITTSNTAISRTPLQVVNQATAWTVAVWQQIVHYDANSVNTKNPDLRLDAAMCLNDSVYSSVSYTIWPSSGGQNPLTWATVQEQDAVGAVPEPVPDSPAVVP